MAATDRQVVHLKIDLDSTSAKKGVESLNTAMQQGKAKMKELLKSGYDPSSEEVKNLQNYLDGIQAMIDRVLISYRDMADAIKHIRTNSQREAESLQKQLVARTKTLRPFDTSNKEEAKKAAAELATAREQYELTTRYVEKLNIKRRDFVSAWNNINKQSADQITQLVKQASNAVLTADPGSQMQRMSMSYYKKFREYQEKANGEMSLGLASRLARGSKKGDLQQLIEANKYLKEYSAEWDKFLTKGQSSKLAENIGKSNDRILSMSRNIANGSIKASYQDMQSALKVIEERWKSLDPNVKKNQSTIRELGLEYNKLKSDIDQWGKTTMTKADAGNVLAQSLRLIKQGVDADVSALKYYKEQLVQAQSAEGLLVKQKQHLVLAEKQVDDLLKSSATERMSAATIAKLEADSQALLTKGRAAEASEVARVIELYKKLVVQSGLTLQERDAHKASLKQLEQLYKEEAKAAMSYGEVLDVLRKGENAEVTEIKRAIEACTILANQQGTLAGQAQQYNNTISELQGLMNKTSKSARNLAEEEAFIKNTLENIRTTPIENLERASMLLKRRLNDAQTSLKEYVKSSYQLKKVKAEMDAINGTLKANETFFTKAITKLASYLGIFGGFYLVRQKMTEAFQANLKYDDSLSNIRKTTGLTAEAVAMLADNIKRISTRTTLQEMNDLAYSAGRLGVKGVSNIMGFVRAADKIKIALGEQLGDSSAAIEQLMKITSIMGVQDQYGLEDAVIRIGSSMNHLTMNSQATAQPIVDFMKRIAGVSTQAGVTASELSGLGAAVSALGQPVEMSATSISKMLVQISGHSDKVAKALKMTKKETEDFMYSIGSGQMMDAFLMVLQKTNESGGLSHLSTIVKDLGSNGQRVIQTIATLAENYDIVAKMVNMSTDAFEKGTSVINEYNIKQSNTAALWEKIKNKFAKNMVSTEAVDFIRGILIELQSLPDTLKNLALSFKPLFTVLKEFIELVSNFPEVIGALTQAMIATAVWNKFIVFIRLGTTSVVRFTVAVSSLTKGFKGMFAFLKTASFGNILTAGLTIALTVWERYAKKARETKQIMEDNIELLQRTKNQTVETTATIQGLIAKISASNKGTKERKELIDQINNTYGEYLAYQIKDAEGNEAIAESLRQVNKELELKALLEGKAQKNKEIDEKYSTQIGKAEYDLENTIAGFMQGGSDKAKQAVAANILNTLISKDADGNRLINSVLETEKDNLGYVTKYSSPFGTWGAATKARDASTLLDSIIKQSIEQWNGVPANSEDQVYSSAVYAGYRDSILKGIVSYLNIEVNRESEKRQSDKVWDRDISKITGDVSEKIISDVTTLWGKIEENVTQGGKYANKKVSESTEDKDKERWVKENSTLPKDDLLQLSKDTKAYLNRIDDYMRYLEGEGKMYKPGTTEKIEANYTDEYAQQVINKYNAEQRLRVLRVGEIEVPDDDKEASAAAKDAKKEFENLIKKIETLYKQNEEELNVLRLEGKLTKVELEEKLIYNNIERNSTLAQARGAITGDLTNEEWNAYAASQIKSISEAGKVTLGYIRNVKNPNAIGVAINKDQQEDGNSFINSIREGRAENLNTVRTETLKLANEVTKAWRDQNPLGKITDEWFDTFQKLDIMFGETPLEKNREEIMKAYREIGEEAYKFDIKTVDGMEHFKETVMNMPILKDQLKALEPDQLDEALRKIYYKAYEYAEQYNEAMTRLVTKQQNLWKRMFAANFVTMESEMDKLFTEQMKQINNFMENFGLSKRIGLENEIKSRQQTLKKAYQEWMYMRQRAEAALEAAKKSGDVDEIKQAEEHIKTLEKPTSAVISAFKSVEEAQLALRLSNHEWLASVEKSIEKFSDDFIKLQSWYDINMHRNMVDNMFGSKADRQKAFATFMDDLKRYMREAMVEYTREKVSKWILDKLPKKKKEDTENQMVTEAKSVAEELKQIDKDVADNKNDLQQQAVDNHSKALSVRLDNESSYYEASIQQYENYIAELESIDYSYETFLRNMRLADGDDSLLLASNNDNMLGEVVKDMKTMGQSISGQYAKDKTTDKTDEQAGSYYRTPGDLQYDEKFIAGDIRSKADSSYQKGHPLENEMKGFVIHMTGSNASADSIAKNVFNPGNTKSAWAVINKDGSRVMMMQPNEVAGHAGIGNASGTKGTQWKNYGDPTLAMPNANDYMIGIENVGNANKEQLTDAQMKSMLEAMMPIILAQRIPLENIVSHGEVAPNYKADVSKDDIVRFRQFLKENLYDLNPKLPLTSADADAYWAQPDWKEKWNKESNGKQWTPYPTEVDKSYEYNGPRPSGKVVSAPEVKESAKELVDAIKADLPTVVNVTEPFTPYPTEVDKSYEYNGPRPSGKVVSAPDANLGAGEIPTGVIGQGLDMTVIEELRKNNYYGSAILAILEESKVANTNPIDSQVTDNAGSSNAGQSLILGNPESSEEENDEGTWLDKQMAKVPELKASYEDLAKERGEQIANIVMAEDQGEATINAIKSEAAKQSSQIIQKSTDKIFNIKKKEINKEQKTEKAANKAKTKEEENVNNELLQSTEDLAASTIKVDSKVKDVKVSNSAVASQEIQKDEAETATTSMWGSFGGAMAKAWEVGGPYLGPILAGVVSAALGAVMSMVFNMIGGGKDSATAVPKTKLVTGMLTYDKGNVQSWRVGPVKTYASGNTEDFVPVMGDDGKVYYASQANAGLATGMVTRPTLTTVNGVPSLVGERGPEMVIGRETTAAMQMYAPELLKQIVLFDRNRSNGYAKTYDSGNVGTITVDDNDNENENMRTMLLAMNEALNQSNAINAQLVAQLQKGIAAHINKNGAGGLIDEVASGLVETRRMGTNKNVTRLFG